MKTREHHKKNMEPNLKTVFHSAGSRGFADHGWLLTHHTFSFADYFNPGRIQFGALRVINDDIVMRGMGFGMHPHSNMEIISIPLEGSLRHSDNTGTTSVIGEGDVQIMSAGSGIKHAEFNNSLHKEVNFLQIWIFPEEKDIIPRYDQRYFDPLLRKNKFQAIVSPDNKDNSLQINQQAWLWLADPEAGRTMKYTLKNKGNGIYLFVIEGSVEAEGHVLNRRDGLEIENAGSFLINAKTDSRLLLIEIPMLNNKN